MSTESVGNLDLYNDFETLQAVDFDDLGDLAGGVDPCYDFSKLEIELSEKNSDIIYDDVNSETTQKKIMGYNSKKKGPAIVVDTEKVEFCSNCEVEMKKKASKIFCPECGCFKENLTSENNYMPHFKNNYSLRMNFCNMTNSRNRNAANDATTKQIMDEALAGIPEAKKCINTILQRFNDITHLITTKGQRKRAFLAIITQLTLQEEINKYMLKSECCKLFKTIPKNYSISYNRLEGYRSKNQIKFDVELKDPFEFILEERMRLKNVPFSKIKKNKLTHETFRVDLKQFIIDVYRVMMNCEVFSEKTFKKEKLVDKLINLVIFCEFDNKNKKLIQHGVISYLKKNIHHILFLFRKHRINFPKKIFKKNKIMKILS